MRNKLVTLSGPRINSILEQGEEVREDLLTRVEYGSVAWNKIKKVKIVVVPNIPWAVATGSVGSIRLNWKFWSQDYWRNVEADEVFRHEFAHVVTFRFIDDHKGIYDRKRPHNIIWKAIAVKFGSDSSVCTRSPRMPRIRNTHECTVCKVLVNDEDLPEDTPHIGCGGVFSTKRIKLLKRVLKLRAKLQEYEL